MASGLRVQGNKPHQLNGVQVKSMPYGVQCMTMHVAVRQISAHTKRHLDSHLQTAEYSFCPVPSWPVDTAFSGMPELASTQSKS